MKQISILSLSLACLTTLGLTACDEEPGRGAASEEATEGDDYDTDDYGETEEFGDTEDGVSFAHQGSWSTYTTFFLPSKYGPKPGPGVANHFLCQAQLTTDTIPWDINSQAGFIPKGTQRTYVTFTPNCQGATLDVGYLNQYGSARTSRYATDGIIDMGLLDITADTPPEHQAVSLTVCVYEQNWQRRHCRAIWR